MPYLNKEERRLNSRKYRLANLEKIKENHRKDYLKNRERYLENSKIYQQKIKENNPEKFYSQSRARLAKYHKTNKGIYKVLSTRCKKKNIPLMPQSQFSEWYDRQEKKCIYCDIPVSLIHLIPINFGKKRLSIDKIDPEIGYLDGNIALACLLCNFVKRDVFDRDTMRKLAQAFIKPLWTKKQQS